MKEYITSGIPRASRGLKVEEAEFSL